MKYILYNPKKEDIISIKREGVRDKDILIIDLRDRFKEFNSINFRDKHKYHKVRTRSWLQKWSYSRIGGKTIKEIFSYQGQTLFYLLSYFFIREFFLFKRRVGLNLTFTLIDILEDFIGKNTNSINVISYDPHKNHFLTILKRVCNKKKVKLRVIKNKSLRIRKIGRHNLILPNPGMLRALIKLRILFRYFIGRYRHLTMKIDKNIKDVLILSNIRFSKLKDEENIMFGPIVEELKRQKISYKIINYELPDIEYLGPILKKFMHHKTNYIGDYYRISIFKENKYLFNLFRKKWSDIKCKKELKETFVYKGINIYDLAEPLFDLIFNAIFYLIADNINITRELLDNEKPKLFVLDHEDNFYGKGLLINAKNTKIRSVALQHEVVEPYDCNHSHIRDGLALKKSSVLWRPLPDKKCASGPYAKRVLLQLCNYPPNRIEITGNPRFDNLIRKKYNANKLLRKFGLRKDDRKVLYAAQEEDIAELFYSAISKINNVIFLVKPHPLSSMHFFKEMQRKVKSKNVILFPKYTNIYELIAISEIVITRTSTVGLEAMIKGVPIIIFNPKKEFDPWGYVKGGALEANNADELKKHVMDLLFTTRVRERIKRMTQRFVYQHAYKNDGKASERVVKVIKKLLRKN